MYKDIAVGPGLRCPGRYGLIGKAPRGSVFLHVLLLSNWKKSYLSTRNKIQTSVCRGGGGGDRPDWAPATEGHFFRFSSKRHLSPSSLHYNTRFQLIDNGWPRVDILLWSFPSQNINVKIKRNHTNAVCLTLSTLYP